MKKIARIALSCLCVLALSTSFAAAAAKSAAKKPAPDEVIRILQEGNDRFVNGKPTHPHSDAARVKQAGAESQGDHALATVLGCSDSRVPPEILFDTGIMDIFVVRVAGNVANTDEIGSIEYGLAHVHTPVLVVLGHTQCGAVTAVSQEVQGKGHALERNIPPLVSSIVPAVKQAMADHPGLRDDAVVPYAIEQNVWNSVERLFLKSPAVRNLVKSGKTKVVGAMYYVGTGRVKFLPDAKVAEILKKVEADPNRETEPMASGKGGH